MKELVEYIAKSIVNSPDAVVVTEETTEQGITLKLQVADEDKGRVIGKQGRIAEAMRTLVRVKAAKALLGRHEEARADYEEALRVSTEFRFRPEIALTRLQLAELLLEHYPKEKKEALEHLDFAIKEFREMKMQPSLERALRHKEILKA